jgi:hypothetical protein
MFNAIVAATFLPEFQTPIHGIHHGLQACLNRYFPDFPQVM